MKYFGTDGIRQPANQFTPDFLTKIVKGLVDYAGNGTKVLLGGDTRESTEWILSDLENALETFGIEYSNAGVLPTPAISYCFYEMGFDFAIDVTASHNPYTDNGIKIFERDTTSGIKLCPQGCNFIEKSLATNQNYDTIPSSLREDLHAEAVDLYKEHLLNYLGTTDFTGLRLGMDCANGATSVIGDSLFTKLGAQVKLINAGQSYGTKINANCGSTHLEPLIQLVKTDSLDFGVAFDGDGDRCLCVDGNGAIVDGDEIIAILADFFHLDTIAITLMANQGILNWATKNHIKTAITPVGDANVWLAMAKQNISLGGEQNGHIILPRKTSGDGMLTALVIAKVIAETNQPLHQLARIITKLPQVVINLPATPAQKSSLATDSAVKPILAHFEEKVKSMNGRLLVRPSGTEPLIRITMWGNDEQTISLLANELKDKLKETLQIANTASDNN